MFKNFNKLFFFLILILLVSIFAAPQKSLADDVEFSWAKLISGISNEYVMFTELDSNKNIYSVRSFSGTADFDPGEGSYSVSSAGDFDAYILKLDPDGNFLWVKTFGGVGADNIGALYIGSDDNIYISGNFTGTVDFDPGAGIHSITSTSGSRDLYILKLDPDGNFLWVKTFEGSGVESVDNIRLDLSGNIYIPGYFTGTADFDPGAGTVSLTSAGSNDIFILKLDSSGNFVWVKQMGGIGDDYLHGFSINSQGYLYGGGYFSGTSDFDPSENTHELTSLGGSDIFILKLDSSGNFVWVKQIGNTGIYDEAYDLEIDLDGNIYTTGEFSGTVDFNPGDGVANLVSTASQYDIFLSKLDSDGNYLWAKATGGSLNSQGCSISVDSENNVYLGGYFRGTVDFDPGAGTLNFTSPGVVADAFVGRFDSTNGDLIWAKQIGGTLDDRSWGISSGPNGSVYVSLYFQGTPDFDPGTGTANLTSAGGYDVAIVKLTPVIEIPTMTTIDATNIERYSVTLSGNITDTGYENATTRGFEYGLTDSYGTTTTETGSYSTGTFSINIADLDCNTTYHYRSYATNSAGTGYGLDSTFRTNTCRKTSGSTAQFISNFLNTQAPQVNAPITPQITNTVVPVDLSGITKILKLNTISSEVKLIQEYLNTHNYIIATTGPGSRGFETTKYGPLTKKAIMKFQKDHNLKPDGIVGPKTRALMK